MFPYRSAGNCRLKQNTKGKSFENQGLLGGRTRDRTLDLSRVKGVAVRANDLKINKKSDLEQAML
jgi:hypothetical protein